MEWLKDIARKRPLIECITNSVTINDVANVILAVGASPVMGEEPAEVADFVRISSGVLLNVGTISRERLESFRIAMATAAETGRPVVLDPVGVGAARFRTEFTFELLRSHACTVIRGNASEIRTLCEGAGITSGVDVAPGDEITESTVGRHVQTAVRVARSFGCIVSVSGEIDVVTDGAQVYLCRNGVPQMSCVTGTGCSLTGLTAAFVAAAPAALRLQAAARAVAMMGCAGEIAWQRTADKGIGSFRIALMDALSTLDDKTIDTIAKLTQVES